MPNSKLSAVDALTGGKISLATFDDANGNTIIGHVSLAGSDLAPVSPGNPMPVADGALATAIAALAAELAGTATSAGQASALTTLGSILSKLDAVGLSGTVAVQDASAEASLGALATISSNTSGLATAAGQAGALAQQAAVATAAGTPADLAWDGTGSGSLVAISKAIVAAVQSAVAKLGATLAVQQTDPLPAGTNALGTVGVTGTVATTDAAAETALAAIQASVGGTLTVSGKTVVGSPPSSPPLSVSGVDGSGNKQHLLTDTAGALQVTSRNGVTVTQTVVSLTAGSDALLLGANSNRKSCGFFLTTSGVVSYLNMGAVATIANGLPFGQGSAFGYAYTWEGSGVPTNALHMMSPSNATVVVWEGV